MRNFIQEGRTLTYTNAGAAIPAGAVVPVGGIIGVAIADIPSGASGELATEGVFEVPKANGSAINAGTAPIWDVSAGKFVPAGTATAAGDVSGAVVAWATAASAATTVKVKLGAAVGTVAT